MFYKDSTNGITYEIPGKFDYEILLDPAELRFMQNVDDASVGDAEGFTVYEEKKSLFQKKKKEALLGVWYTENEPTTAARAKHAVRLIPPIRHSALMPDSEAQAIVYPIPLYQTRDTAGLSQSYIATLLIFVTRKIIFTSLQGTIESNDLHVLAEQLLTEVSAHDPAVETLLWVRDARNTSACAFPNQAVDFEKDLLLQIIRLAGKTDHILTSEERQNAILRTKKMIQIGVLAGVVATGGVFLLHKIQENERNTLVQLRQQNESFNQALMLQKKEATNYDYLVTSLSKQPDYTWTLLRLYAGTFGLTKRHISMTLKVRSDKPVLIYSITGKNFVKIEDMRPVLVEQLKRNGFVPAQIDLTPKSDMTPEITIQGEASLGVQ